MLNVHTILLMTGVYIYTHIYAQRIVNETYVYICMYIYIYKGKGVP